MSSEKKIFHLVYRSIANPETTEKEIQKILSVSRKLNQKAGITGILITRGPIFLQLLEGVKHKVLTTFRRIQQDERHHSIKTLIEAQGDSPLFNNWSMAYVKDPDEHGALKEILPFLDEAAQLADNSREAILPTLKVFAESIPEEE